MYDHHHYIVNIGLSCQVDKPFIVGMYKCMSVAKIYHAEHMAIHVYVSSVL